MGYALRDWRLSKYGASWVARGAVYNDHRFFDGQRIRTSVVASITPGDASIEVSTKNSAYICPYAECSDSTLDFVNDVALIGAADADAIRQNIQRHVSARLAMEEATAFSAIPRDADCLVLVLTNCREHYFKQCFSRHGGAVSQIAGSQHLGMFQDSVLVVDHNSGVDLRYMPMGGGLLDFYSVKAAGASVYSYNDGSLPLRLRVGGSMHTLQPKSSLILITAD